MKTFTKLRESIADLFAPEVEWSIVEQRLTGGAVIRDVVMQCGGHRVAVPVAALFVGQTLPVRCPCTKTHTLTIDLPFLRRELGRKRPAFTVAGDGQPGMSAATLY